MRLLVVCIPYGITCLSTPPSDRGGTLCSYCEKVRENAANKVRQVLSSPHSELLLGTTLGINDLHHTPRFNDMLVSTGTIHVVVVSGYNINLVLSRFINLFKARKNLFRLITAQIFAVIYALITGFDPPVVRALIMASMVLWGRYYGQKSDQLRLLVLSALLMLVLNPFYLTSLSFQLSFLASTGLVMLAPLIESVLIPLFGKNMFVVDLSTSFSAQIFVLPLLSHHFSRISALGSLINALVLWLIPLITISGFLVVAGSYIHIVLAKYIAHGFSVISSIFINIIDYADNTLSVPVSYTLSTTSVGIYYLFLIGFLGFLLKRSHMEHV